MNILVTGGGTIAPIDDVRQITNMSTGRFSSAISEAALALGGRVWHVHGKGAQVPFAGRARLDLDAPDSAAELDRLRRLQAEWEAVRDRLRLVPLAEGTVPDYARTVRSILTEEPIDAVFLAMAVSDFAPEPDPGKIPSETDELVLRCRRLPKVIRSVRDWAPNVYLVGFKLLSGSTEAELIDRARHVNLQNRADLTVANDLRLLRQGRHTIHLVRPGEAVETIGPEADLAAELVDRVWRWARNHD
jgi:phosphopantothenoylcysteine synthetase/decarboxylase